MSRPLSAAVAAALLVLPSAAGCKFSPFRHIGAVPDSARPGPVLEPVSAGAELTPEAVEDGLFVGLALSGGGSRAAVFGAEILFELQRLGVTDRVDYVSAVSGGAMAAGYYGLSRDPGEAGPHDLVWAPEPVFEALATDFWKPFLLRAASPIGLLAYWFTGYNRSAIMAEVFDAYLFGGRRLGDLNLRRPRLLIQATRLVSGRPFVFGNDTLGELNIRPAPLKMSVAVMASAAFPGFFQTLTLPRYVCGPDGRWEVGSYVHLMDGGVFDNTATKVLMDLYEARRDRFPRGAVILVVDSTRPLLPPENAENRADLRGNVDYLIDTVSAAAAAGVLQQLAWASTVERLRDLAAGNGRVRVIDFHYPRGLLDVAGVPAPARDNPWLFDPADPLEALVDWRQLVGLIAPTDLAISDENLRVTREAARAEVRRLLPQLRAAGLTSHP